MTMSFNRLSSMRSGLGALSPPSAHAFRPPYSNQKRFAATETGNKGGAPRLLLVVAALAVPVSVYLSRRGSPDARQRKTTAHDEPRAMGPPGGSTSMSAKQQGLSNADTMNPYVNEPGKSEKGEGETDTAKLKGTVKVDRPQA